MAAAQPRNPALSVDAVRVTNPHGSAGYVVVCDHASNFLPPEFHSLGLPAHELTRHIAWDPGARAVATSMAQTLDAPVVESAISRLVADCNRPLDAPDLIPTISETTEIPGNAGLDEQSRANRIALAHQPFHEAIDALIEDRLAAGQACAMIAIHTFTPIYRGVTRPWHVGVIHDEDRRLAQPLIDALRALPGIEVGINQPYSPLDRVYYTLERHARARKLPCVMVEIRNDEVRDETGQRRWAALLGGIFSALPVKEGALHAP